MDLTVWTAKLLVTASLLGGFPAPSEPPQVTFQDRAFLAARFCQSACTVRGAYVPLEGVLLDSRLDLDNSPLDRSVLVHELVHFVQDEQRRFRDDGPCDRWKEREIEAYAVQERYLSRYNISLGDGVEAALQILPAGCTLAPDTPDSSSEAGTAHLYRAP